MLLLAFDRVVVPLPVKVTPVVPLINPDRVRPAEFALAKMPPPVPSATALDSAIAVEPVVARVPPFSVSVPVLILFAAEIWIVAPAPMVNFQVPELAPDRAWTTDALLSISVPVDVPENLPL